MTREYTIVTSHSNDRYTTIVTSHNNDRYTTIVTSHSNDRYTTTLSMNSSLSSYSSQSSHVPSHDHDKNASRNTESRLNNNHRTNPYRAHRLARSSTHQPRLLPPPPPAHVAHPGRRCDRRRLSAISRTLVHRRLLWHARSARHVPALGARRVRMPCEVACAAHPCGAGGAGAVAMMATMAAMAARFVGAGAGAVCKRASDCDRYCRTGEPVAHSCPTAVAWLLWCSWRDRAELLAGDRAAACARTASFAVDGMGAMNCAVEAMSEQTSALSDAAPGAAAAHCEMSTGFPSTSAAGAVQMHSQTCAAELHRCIALLRRLHPHCRQPRTLHALVQARSSCICLAVHSLAPSHFRPLCSSITPRPRRHGEHGTPIARAFQAANTACQSS